MRPLRHTDWALATLLLTRGALGDPAAVVLLGPSGSGKSETGNTLLGRQAFNVSGGLGSETLVPQASNAAFQGRDWQIVDTPGYFDTSRTPEELDQAFAQFTDLVSNHIVALAFVVPYGRFGDGHIRAWRLMRSAFGPDALRHTLLIFTGCAGRIEADVAEETQRLCTKNPAPLLCSVLAELNAPTGERLAAFGELSPERRSRDRDQFFSLITKLERTVGGVGYDHRDFLRSRARRRLLAQRIAVVASEAERRSLELLLAAVEAGSSPERTLLEALEAAEGMGPTRRITIDFEDRGLGPLKLQAGAEWKRPLPMPYATWRDYSVLGGGGGNYFLHTGTDSGVRVRHGDTRRGELRAEFPLGRGPVEWLGAGDGGYIAVCPVIVDTAANVSCVKKRIRNRATVLQRDIIQEDELSDLVGKQVFLAVVDDRNAGWGFIALDNIEYPELGSIEDIQAPADSAASNVVYIQPGGSLSPPPPPAPPPPPRRAPGSDGSL